MVSYLILILGALLGVVVLGEQLSWNALVGFGIILAGVMMVNGLFNQQINHLRYYLYRVIHANPGAVTRKGESQEPLHI